MSTTPSIENHGTKGKTRENRDRQRLGAALGAMPEAAKARPIGAAAGAARHGVSATKGAPPSLSIENVWSYAKISVLIASR